MRNIGMLIREDLRRIGKNVIAVIVIMGISIVPSLYAWFNIAASWDPYGNTGSLQVAVASQDKGYEGKLIPVSLNLGDMVLSKLRENEQLDWKFTKAKEAEEGVKNGTYYAAIVIPEDFSTSMLSLFSEEVTHPKITYYLNEKENAIAPKVTDKGAGEVQKQVNEVFVKTVSQIGLDAASMIGQVAKQEGNKKINENLERNMQQISGNLRAAAETARSFASLGDSLSEMLNTTSGLLGSAKESLLSGSDLQKENQNAIQTAEQLVTNVTEEIGTAVDQSKAYYGKISDTADGILSQISQNTSDASSSLSGLADQVQRLIDCYSDLQKKIDRINASLPQQSTALAKLNAKIAQALDQQKAVKEKIQSAADGVTAIPQETEQFRKEIKDAIQTGSAGFTDLKKEYENHIKDGLDDVFETLDQTNGALNGLTGNLEKEMTEIRQAAGTSGMNLEKTGKALQDSAALLDTAAADMETLVSRIQKEGLDSVVSELTKENPETISSFLASPVKLKTESYYPVENYGSAMAPFYSTLSVWVGGIIIVAMMKTGIPKSYRLKIATIKPYQIYLGRYLLFLMIGILQSSLICLGDLYFLNIQCEHPFLFVVTGWITSAVYVNMIYTLTVAFGDIGKAVSVLLLVMQVAGSGGTFPIEVAPGFFRAVYPFLPFVHSMNAMRECIAGFYGNTFGKELVLLSLFLVPSLLLGLLLRKPIVRLMDRFTEKLEETRLM